MTKPNYEGLRVKLDQLAAKGATHLKALASRDAHESGWRVLLTSTIVAPALLLPTVLIDKVAGLGVDLSFATMAFLFVAVPALCWPIAYVSNLMAHNIDRRIALTFYDHQLGVKDRLQIADEFTQKERLSDFEKAAVADATEYVDKALAAKLPPVTLASASLDSSRWKLAAVGAVVLIAAGLLNQAEFDFADDSSSPTLDQRIASVDSRKDSAPEDPLAIEEEEATTQPEAQPVPQPSQKKKSGKPAEGSEPVEPSKASPGTPKAASTASDQESASQQNKSGSAGAGSSSESSGSKDKKKKKEKPAGKQKKKSPTKPKPPTEQEKSSAAGVASGKGNTSGQNPATSEKESAADKAQQEEDGSNDDDPEAEEDEEQKANSNVNPKKSKRKAPVDRRLSPSRSGNQENDQANGRGGASGLKKTRGVAAMLLGVPMPDRLQGTPNPGRTKSIQEQSQPEEQVVATASAANSGISNGPIGQVAHKDLMPQIKAVVREYFTELRTKEVKQGSQTSNYQDSEK